MVKCCVVWGAAALGQVPSLGQAPALDQVLALDPVPARGQVPAQDRLLPWVRSLPALGQAPTLRQVPAPGQDPHLRQAGTQGVWGVRAANCYSNNYMNHIYYLFALHISHLYPNLINNFRFIGVTIDTTEL